MELDRNWERRSYSEIWARSSGTWRSRNEIKVKAVMRKASSSQKKAESMSNLEHHEGRRRTAVCVEGSWVRLDDAIDVDGVMRWERNLKKTKKINVEKVR